MKSLGLKAQVLQFIENYSPGWVHGGSVEDFGISLGYKGSNAGRRCRELENEGKIERKLEKGKVWYKRVMPQLILDGQKTLF